jgi:hypothetical protein
MEKSTGGPTFTVGERIPPKPTAPSGFMSPARWLLSSHLIGGLKKMALYFLSKRDLDVRDWMLPSVDDSFANVRDEFWFDYIADSGDGQLGVYDIAYLCFSDLHHRAGDEPTHLTFESSGADLSLPRGRFLMIGGDTAYPVADAATLQARLQAPFEWAFVDRANESGRPPDTRPLYGIPGNHDYYDELEGFNRQFRKPISGDEAPPAEASDGSLREPQLSLRGFRRTQETSYVALHLPHDWWLWGFDSENASDAGKLDFRQTQFFRALCRANGAQTIPPPKLIVATSEPAIARRLAPKPDDRIIQSFVSLGLKHPLVVGRGEDLEPGTCRLDLSGDTHHYERYDADPNPERPEQDAEPDVLRGSGPARYASVVSGLGGAFFHPSDIFHDGPARRAVFPARERSRNEVPKLLLNPFVIFAGGYAAPIGGLVSAIFALALFSSRSCQAFFDTVFWLLFKIDPDPTALGQFLGHLLFLAALVVLGRALYVSAEIRRRSREHERSFALKWLARGIAALGLLAPIVTTLVVGTASARAFTADVTVAVLAIGFVFGLLFFALSLGAADHPRPRKIAFFFLGLSHALVQIFLPLAIVRAQAWKLAAALCVLPWILWGARRALAHRWPRGLMPVIWFLAVAGAFAAVSIFARPADLSLKPAVPIAVLVAGTLVVATYLTAFWFGFYLAASQEWHGHFNDVGGAARISRFQELIRFRVTADELTGYVIAIDEPQVHGRDLRPRIIDKFTISPR